MNFLIDTHSHVYYDQYKDDLSSVINSAKGNGVERIICVGTDIKTSYESIEIANKYGIDLTSQRARQFSVNDFDEFDKIYAMDSRNYANIISLARDEKDRNKVDVILNESNPKSFQSVPDPYYGGDNGFQNVYKMLEEACDIITQNFEKR